MATLKQPKDTPSLFEYAKTRHAELEANSPIIESRYKVVEYIPFYDDREVGFVSERVLQAYYFETEEGAQDFIDTHIPDDYAGRPGAFRVVPEYLREFKEKRWVSY